MGGIFISYRRDDSRHAAGRLVDNLAHVFPREYVFMDVDNIDPGLDFVQEIGDRVAQCDAMLMLIGPQWITARDENGRRLDDPNDFVRVEVEQALVRNVRVIPILVDGARPPRADDLPATLQSLSRRQAAQLNHATFGADAAKIADVLKRAVAVQPAPASQPQPEAVGQQKDLPTVTRELILAVARDLKVLNSTYIHPDIPPAKLANAYGAVRLPPGREILVLFDNTLFGGAKDCIAVTVEGVYRHELGEYDTLSWSEIAQHPVDSGWTSLKIAGRSWNLGAPKPTALAFFQLIRMKCV